MRRRSLLNAYVIRCKMFIVGRGPTLFSIKSLNFHTTRRLLCLRLSLIRTIRALHLLNIIYLIRTNNKASYIICFTDYFDRENVENFDVLLILTSILVYIFQTRNVLYYRKL